MQRRVGTLGAAERKHSYIRAADLSLVGMRVPILQLHRAVSAPYAEIYQGFYEIKKGCGSSGSDGGSHWRLARLLRELSMRKRVQL